MGIIVRELEARVCSVAVLARSAKQFSIDYVRKVYKYKLSVTKYKTSYIFYYWGDPERAARTWWVEW